MFILHKNSVFIKKKLSFTFCNELNSKWVLLELRSASDGGFFFFFLLDSYLDPFIFLSIF